VLSEVIKVLQVYRAVLYRLGQKFATRLTSVCCSVHRLLKATVRVPYLAVLAVSVTVVCMYTLRWSAAVHELITMS
jgi:hypothetical protein